MNIHGRLAWACLLLAGCVPGAQAAPDLRQASPVQVYPVVPARAVPPVQDYLVRVMPLWLGPEAEQADHPLFESGLGLPESDWPYSGLEAGLLDGLFAPGMARDASWAPLRMRADDTAWRSYFAASYEARPWEYGGRSWRYTPASGSVLTLGRYTQQASWWGGAPRLGGVAWSQAKGARQSAGHWDYTVAVGALDYLPDDVRRGGLDYGPGATAAQFSYGLSPQLALTSQLQWAPELLGAGLGGRYNLSDWGTWRAGVASATREDHQGWRYRVGYETNLLEDAKLAWRAERRSGTYADLENYAAYSPGEGSTRNAWSASVLLGRWGKVEGTYERVSSSSLPVRRYLGVSQQFWYSPRLRITLNAMREQVQGDYSWSLQFSLPLR